MSAFVVDTSIALKWFLEDEEDRADSLNILKGISETNRPVVPWLWFYEIGNALTFAVRRKRVVFEQVEEFLRLLEQMPIDVDEPDRATALRLPYLCREHNLTTYDAAYLELAMRLQLPVGHLRQCAYPCCSGCWGAIGSAE